MLLFTARKRSLGQGNIFTPVCHSVHRGGHAKLLGGGHAWLLGGGMHGFIRGACIVLFKGGMRGFIWGGAAWFFQFFRIQCDTVNERAVRILLECILVQNSCPFMNRMVYSMCVWLMQKQLRNAL